MKTLIRLLPWIPGIGILLGCLEIILVLVLFLLGSIWSSFLKPIKILIRFGLVQSIKRPETQGIFLMYQLGCFMAAAIIYATIVS